ncbi:uncharacterized protein V1510DRAFT_409492 [Dipodascopsis tothii]|uniref:uncharacterized protein n=1 Tax=Dipodascopsis tothii TaxID=44089 RepID=UPI0034CDDF3A
MEGAVDFFLQDGRSQRANDFLTDKMIIEKYTVAGNIVQNVMTAIVKLLTTYPDSSKFRNTYDICKVSDSFLKTEIERSFQKIKERGIAWPTTVDVNNCVSGYSPQQRRDAYVLSDGDVVKLTLGVHIEGYTCRASHTIVVRPLTPPAVIADSGPVRGDVADTVIATHAALKAVTALLGSVLYGYTTPSGYFNNSPVTGERIRQVVEKIARIYGVRVLPGSSVRTVRQYLAGQCTVKEAGAKGYEWGSFNRNSSDETEQAAKEQSDNSIEEIDASREFDAGTVAEGGEAWLVDISMCSMPSILPPAYKTGSFVSKYNKSQVSRKAVRAHDKLLPTVFSRDYAASSHDLRTQSARSLLAVVEATKSVYPFAASTVNVPGMRAATVLAGLRELERTGLIIPTHVETVKAPGSNANLTIAREQTTLLLIPSVEHGGYGKVLRLSGAEANIPPSWAHSDHEILDPELLNLVTSASSDRVPEGKIKIKNVTTTIDLTYDLDKLGTEEMAEMELD